MKHHNLTNRVSRKGCMEIGGNNHGRTTIPSKIKHNWCNTLTEEEVTHLLKIYNINGYKLD